VPIRLSIDVDEPSIQEKVKNLIDKINSVFSFINNQNTYVSGSSKPLTGDVNLNMVRQSIVSLAYTEVSENSTYKTLSSIGINFGKDGTLKLDTSKFSSALTSNREEVINVLRTFGDSLYDKLNVLIDPYTGTLTSIKTGIENELSRIDEKIGELEERFEREKEVLEKRYAALELLISESNLLKGWMENQVKAMFGGNK
jgi:flagellar hook-associated protein 2